MWAKLGPNIAERQISCHTGIPVLTGTSDQPVDFVHFYHDDFVTNSAIQSISLI
jgi:hypothetical protein